MSGFKLDDYVDVAERIRVFKTEFPLGTLQGEGEFVRDEQGCIVGYLYKAFAYRESDDPRPGIGHAFEPIPGKTPYTKDSEVMNAETSAWGRAIVALGFETKKIASAEEVRNRQNGEGDEADRAVAIGAIKAALKHAKQHGSLPPGHENWDAYLKWHIEGRYKLPEAKGWRQKLTVEQMEEVAEYLMEQDIPL
jgi:hypothetical protein